MIIYFDTEGAQISFWMAKAYRTQSYARERYESEQVTVTLSIKPMKIVNDMVKDEEGELVPAFDVSAVTPDYELKLKRGFDAEITLSEGDDYEEMLQLYRDALVEHTFSYYDDDGNLVEIGNALKVNEEKPAAPVDELALISSEHANFGTW